MKMSHAAVLAALLLAAGGATSANTILVPGDQPSIAAGLALATVGDVVEVACGIYAEHGLSMQSGVTLRSATGDPACVIIDAQGAGRILDCYGCEATTTIEGITFANGSAVGAAWDGTGGSLLVVAGAPQFWNCLFRDCDALSGGACALWNGASASFNSCTFSNCAALTAGGALYVTGSEPTFLACVFTGNEAGNYGGVAHLYNASPFFDGCRFEDNEAISQGGGGVDGYDGSAPSFLQCVFRLNRTGGLGGALRFDFNCAAMLDGCTIAENHADGGAGAVFTENSSTVIMDYTIIVFNTQGRPGYDTVACGNGASAGLFCSDVFGNSGGDWTGCIVDQADDPGNIALDPQFCGAPGSGNLYLQSDSPCSVANNSDCFTTLGALEVGCQATATEATNWGAFKRRY